jgi:hypothetical protein
MGEIIKMSAHASIIIMINHIKSNHSSFTSPFEDHCILCIGRLCSSEFSWCDNHSLFLDFQKCKFEKNLLNFFGQIMAKEFKS